jgi:hypothetical protein
MSRHCLKAAMRLTTTAPRRAISVTLALLGAALPARADDHGPRVPMPPKYLQECASCHAAYPPGLLPAPSWQRVMGNLSKHYGTDASLDAATVQELTGWLTAQAGTPARAGAPGRRLRRTASHSVPGSCANTTRCALPPGSCRR